MIHTELIMTVVHLKHNNKYAVISKKYNKLAALNVTLSVHFPSRLSSFCLVSAISIQPSSTFQINFYTPLKINYASCVFLSAEEK